MIKCLEFYKIKKFQEYFKIAYYIIADMYLPFYWGQISDKKYIFYV